MHYFSIHRKLPDSWLRSQLKDGKQGNDTVIQWNIGMSGNGIHEMEYMNLMAT